MWLAAEHFQFAWKKMSGDVALSADISFWETVNPHRQSGTDDTAERMRIGVRGCSVACNGIDGVAVSR